MKKKKDEFKTGRLISNVSYKRSTKKLCHQFYPLCVCPYIIHSTLPKLASNFDDRLEILTNEFVRLKPTYITAEKQISV